MSGSFRSREARRVRRRRGRLRLAAVVLVVTMVGVLVVRVTGSGADDSLTSVSNHAGGVVSQHTRARAPHRELALRVVRLTTLAAPVQDAAVTRLGGRVYAFGGLDAAGTSIATISVLRGSTVRTAGRLPVPIHDAAAASSPSGRVYVMGGGQFASAPGIARFDPATARTGIVGAFPTPLSDLAVATVGATNYVVGGYTGLRWSNRIYAVRDARVRQVGVLPIGLRYAAVAALGNAVVIAGGRTQTGASQAIYSFSTVTGKVTRVGTLPTGLMHAAAGTLDGVMYVIGGITSTGKTVRSVLAVDPDGSVHQAATLPSRLSDAGVASLPHRIVVIGGSTGAGPTRSVLQLSIGPPPKHKTPRHKTAPKTAEFTGPLPGDLLIADRGNNRMLVVNPRHKILWRYPNRPGQAHLFFDDDTFFVPGGHAIISNQEENDQIVEITYPGGHLVWSYGHPGVKSSAAGYLNTPDDAYKLRNGLVIVADAYNCRILELRGHRIIRSIGQAGHCTHDPPRYLGAVNGDTPLPNGHILVSEITGSYVDEFTLSGKLVHVYKAPVSYPSDPQLTRNGNILLADYSRPGGLVILNRRTGRVLWSYRVAAGWGMLDHPSLAAMLPNGMIAVNDDYNDRVVIINPQTQKIVWQYGHLRQPGRRPGYLNTPDGFDYIPVTPTGHPDPAAIKHGP